MTNLSPTLYFSFQLSPTAMMSPQNSWPTITGFSATLSGTRLCSAPSRAALWVDMHTLSEMIFTCTSSGPTSGRAISSSRRSIFP